MSDDLMTIEELRDRIEEVRVAMVSTLDTDGVISSRPLRVQRIDDRGGVWFVVDHRADWVGGGLATNVALVDPGRTWVSVSGTTEMVLDGVVLEDLWDEHTSTWFGDDRSSAAALVVRADRWEYWTAPNRIGQMVEQAKALLMDRRPDPGGHGEVETR